MVQAARSGKQNIAEASVASGTSKEMEIKLTNVARASLEELLIDYREFLRSRDLVGVDAGASLRCAPAHPEPDSRSQLRDLPPRRGAR